MEDENVVEETVIETLSENPVTEEVIKNTEEVVSE